MDTDSSRTPNRQPVPTWLDGLLPATLRGRLALTLVVVIFGVMVALGAYLVFAAKDLYVERLRDQMERQVQIIARAVGPAVDQGTIEAVDPLVKELSADVDTRITIVAEDGTVLGDSEADPRTMENHGGRAEIEEALRRGFGSSERTSSTLDEAFIYVAAPIPGNSGAVARVAQPLVEVDIAIRRVQRDVAIAAGVAAVLVAAAGIFVSRRITEPLDELRGHANQVASGRLEVAVRPASTRELGDLAHAFNMMTDRIRGLIRDSERSRQRLAAIVQNLSDGVILTDASQRVIDLNPAASRMLEASARWAAGQPFVVVARDHELADLLQKAMDGGEVTGATIEVGRRRKVLEAAAQRVTGPGEVLGVVVLRDITELRRLESVRREFVANVSHELRTPLASIRALVETLEAGAASDPEVAPDFLHRIVSEVDRLSALVNELLDLGRLESGRVTLKLEALDSAEVLRHGAERLRPQTERAGLTLDILVPDGLPTMAADRARIEQVLINLVHNAIKFTPTGGRIEVSATVADEMVEVSVADTGVGIDEEELPRVFERFYKADKSRRSDGTGLGLAITKHIVQAHQGTVWATSTLGEGSTFTFTIPLAGERIEPLPMGATSVTRR
ncbi:MAG: ATP-binding protein [Thermomicrobiales bacterium]